MLVSLVLDDLFQFLRSTERYGLESIQRTVETFLEQFFLFIIFLQQNRVSVQFIKVVGGLIGAASVLSFIGFNNCPRPLRRPRLCSRCNFFYKQAQTLCAVSSTSEILHVSFILKILIEETVIVVISPNVQYGGIGI